MNENTRNTLFSHKSDHWATPKKIYDFYMKKGAVDPTPLHCEEDNLEKDFGDVHLYINPPYSNISAWVDYALEHCEKYRRRVVMLLVPSRTDTKWFQKLLTHKDYDVNFAFFKGRLKFGDSNASAPFPSVLIGITYGWGNKAISSVTLDDFE